MVDHLVDASLNESFCDSQIQDFYAPLNSTFNSTFSELPSLNGDLTSDSIDESGFVNDYECWWIQW